MQADRTPSIALSFVIGFVVLSTINIGWRFLVSFGFHPRWALYAILTTTGLLGMYASLWRAHRIGLVVIPVHLGIVMVYFGVFEIGYRTSTEWTAVVVSWGLLVGIVFLNADYFTTDTPR
ncbi:hypothetical protein [Natronobacterium texcoconense]|uniref:Uncharacterized protein n=1 Tax=Natronobacterium texcoconense TaxID=1095778 RepID=A0A1H1IED3_NATTX|nr:hypothetical protein [Natronobacterium texcoconense]SDR36040.1 hypothetical protein SAMN04489842_3487 [Natronobacterium texcoconense]